MKGKVFLERSFSSQEAELTPGIVELVKGKPCSNLLHEVGIKQKKKGERRMLELQIWIRWIAIGLGVLLAMVGIYLLGGQKNHDVGFFFVTVGASIAAIALILNPNVLWFPK